jgi:hypothetical protein
MFEQANEELEKIDPFNRAAPEVLAVRIGGLSWIEKMGVDARSRQTSG